MEREKQIMEAAIKQENEYGAPYTKNAFIEGVKWAEENPKSEWRDFNKTQPEKGEKVLIRLLHNSATGVIIEYVVSFFVYEYNGKRVYIHAIGDLFSTAFYDEIHWMPIPKFEM